MSSDRPDPSDFLAQAQRMLRELFGEARGGDEEPWAGATRSAREARRTVVTSTPPATGSSSAPVRSAGAPR